jgi:hypothetical protein
MACLFRGDSEDRDVALAKYSAIVVPDFRMRNLNDLERPAAIRCPPNAIKSLNLKALIIIRLQGALDPDG